MSAPDGEDVWFNALNGDAAEVQRAIAHGADPNHVGVRGWSSLFAAAARGHEEAVQVLLVSGADTELQTCPRTSPSLRHLPSPSARRRYRRSRRGYGSRCCARTRSARCASSRPPTRGPSWTSPRPPLSSRSSPSRRCSTRAAPLTWSRSPPFCTARRAPPHGYVYQGRERRACGGG